MSALRRLVARLRLRRSPEAFDKRPAASTDALTAAYTQHSGAPDTGAGGYPPGWVKSYDEGRPRK